MRLDPLYTERLVVREFSTADREGLMSFVRDQDALKYMMFSMKDAAELDSFLSMATAGSADPARGDYHCAIALREHPGDCIGCVSLMGSILNPDSVELGYFIRRDFWGRGMTLEASRALIDWGFAKLKLHRVWGKCDTLNPGSARVLEKLGMKLEGTSREHVWLHDHWRSSFEYGILDREWKFSGTTESRDLFTILIAREKRLFDNAVRCNPDGAKLLRYVAVKQTPDGTCRRSNRSSVWRRAEGNAADRKSGDWKLVFHQGTDCPT